VSAIRVLFVCQANICRSPLAQGVLERELKSCGLDRRVTVDSAGTHPYRIGELPDPRAREVATRRGLDIASQRARQIQGADYDRFDYVVAMDDGSLEILRYTCPKERHSRLHLFMDFVPGERRRNVPDPYLGEAEQFEEVLDILEIGCKSLLADIKSRVS
jgi:protein-tyrosine phosphatase